jgi:hypothetical protein
MRVFTATHRDIRLACLSAEVSSLASIDARLNAVRSSLPAGAVGGAFFHATDGRFFCPFEPHNSSQQSCEGL